MKGTLKNYPKITGKLTPVGQKITGTVTAYGLPNPYSGPYDVTPKVDPQLLLTAGKSLREDITVWGIPYTEVSNKDGTTCIIG